MDYKAEDLFSALGMDSPHTPSGPNFESVAMLRYILENSKVYQPLFADFTSLYLPEFIRYYLLKIDCLQNFTFSALVMNHISDLSLFGRFVREDQTGLAVTLGLVLISRLKRSVSFDGILDEKSEANPFSIFQLSTSSLLLLRLLLAFQPTATAAFLPSPSAQDLSRRLTLAARDLQVSAHSLASDPSTVQRATSTAEFLSSLSQALGGTKIEVIREGMIRYEGKVLSWYCCEGRGAGGCEEEKTGSPFVICSKCRAARYCSREHQVSHWPIHRKTCRQPVWGQT
ncbi:hypothetical protein BDY24DRAFT_387882 [Mrakia frigida]|uniref:zinc finger MYND domain-containing protein n=1 Tax=Mrakia frigida TaxID=29902 RepID=UPI003FCC2400